MNKELVWLYTHCTAIGMDCKSDSGTLEEDIALFTILQDQRIKELEAEVDRLNRIKSRTRQVELQAECEQLRELFDGFEDTILFRMGSGSPYRKELIAPFWDRAKQVLAATPKQSLAHVRNKAKDEAIEACRKAGPQEYPNKLITDGYVAAIEATKEAETDNEPRS